MGETRFGPYILLERVSVGGMAEIFRARRASEGDTGKLLAVKRILPNMIEDDIFRQMFADEANIAGQLVHRNIARIYENGTADSYPYIAMEYVWGKDLLQIQNRFRKLRQKMPPAMACHIVIKLCEALDYAHRRVDANGKPMLIVHRDCSPQNVIASYKGDVKLVDFGIAKAAERLTMTAAGDVKGKLSYMAPEQIAGRELDRRVDVYGAGVVLFELLLGDRLISATTHEELIKKARAGILPRPSDVMPDIAPALEEIILTAVARDPAKRYGWCSEMRNALVAFMSSAGMHFDSDDLSIWLKGAFAVEMMREAEDLETLPTFEGHLLPSEYDERTLAEPMAVMNLGGVVASVGPGPGPDKASSKALGLAIGKTPLVKEIAAPAEVTASRRMASTISRAELVARSATNSHPPAMDRDGATSLSPSPTKVLPRISNPPPQAAARAASLAASASAEDEETVMVGFSPRATGSGGGSILAEEDEMEETSARIDVVVAPIEVRASAGAGGVSSASSPAPRMPSRPGQTAALGPSVTATVSIIPPPAKRQLWVGVVIGVAIAALVAAIAILVLA